MRNLTSIFMATGLIIMTGCAGTINKLTSDEVAQGWELLFNGKNMDNWRLYNSEGTGTWHIEKGCLAADGTGSDSSGYIITRKEYASFDLAFAVPDGTGVPAD
jgi:hypothetical protein